MAVKDLRVLLERLNEFCTKKLESSVGLCVTRGHYELRWEHLFREFLDSAEGDIPVILAHFGIDPALLKKGINQELETLKTGNSGKPSFSPPLIDMVERAFNISSLSLGRTTISSGALLLAAMEQGLTAMAAYAPMLKPCNREILAAQFDAITAKSMESSGGQMTNAGAATPEAGLEVLKQFCTNFTDQARSGKIDPILGRDDEIRQALDILNRRRKNNPILVGEAGVGKTAIVEGLALRIAANDVPDHLKGVDLWGLDLGLLQAGASVKGEFEKRLKNVIDAIKNSPTPTILFIDEAHTLIGAGGAAGQNDAANLLKPALARGELRTLAATTWAEYRKYFEKDPALARRFQLVKIEEPDEERCSIMLRGIGASYEKYHGVRVTYEGIRAAVNYSHRYISGRQLPDKAVDVLDTACARVKMSQSTKPSALDVVERSMLNAQLELKTLKKDFDAGVITSREDLDACETRIAAYTTIIAELTDQWTKEKVLVASIIDLHDRCFKAREANGPDVDVLAAELATATAELSSLQGENPMVFPYVSGAVCAAVIADWTGIPVGSMMKDEAQTLLTIEQKLCERVAGQDEALAEIASTVRAAKTGMSNPDAPIGVFLFAGPSGVGKTETALAMADLLFGGEKFMTVINMSEYQEKHTVSQLKGAPPGYVGYGEGGILTEAVRQKPYSIVILDEVEKAHLEVMNLFYQVFDKGFMRDGEGREINFRNTIIVMTSNLGSDEIVQLCSGETPASLNEIVDTIRPVLSAHFKPALLARSKVVPFKALGADIMKSIVAMKLGKVAKRILAAHRITLEWSDALIDAIAAQCTTVEAGARQADIIIGQTILPQISMKLLEALGEEDTHYTRIFVGENEENELSIQFFEE